MLRAFAVNPTTHYSVPTIFPPPDCEVCIGYNHAHQASIFSALVSFLEMSGATGAFETTSEFTLPGAWDDIPHSSGIEEVVLTGPEAAEVLLRLNGYELNEKAFLDYWKRFLYGASAGSHMASEDSVVAEVAENHLEFLRRVLAAGSSVEWLLVYDM